jgi:hypothetical protein
VKAYVIGSLKNHNIPIIANLLRNIGLDAFDDWWAVGPEADDYWLTYERQRGRSYEEALLGYAARNTFNFDKHHIDHSDIGILVMPAGKSAHLELGYMAGRGKLTYVLFDKEPERYDVMYQFADKVFFDTAALLTHLSALMVDKERGRAR